MKKNILTLVILTCLFVVSTTQAQKFKPLDKSPMDAATFPDSWRVSNKELKVVYSRPQLKGRSLEMLAPPNKVWRTGANEAAEITFYKDVIFGGEKVASGTYSLFTIPSKTGDWTVILNKAKNVWGHYTYKKEEDVVRVKGYVSKTTDTIEAFSMIFDTDKTLKMGWENTVISVPISTDVSEASEK